MRIWKRFILAVLVLAAMAAGLHFGFRPAQEDGTQEIKNRIAQLKDKVDKARKEPSAYVPKNPGQIVDLSLNIGEMLRQLPGIARVEVLLPVKNPTHRIVHLRDWHLVPKDHFALDMKEAHKRPLSQQEVDLLHQELLLEAELVQIEQVALLQALVKHHGLKRVFSEGLTKTDLAAYRERVTALRGAEKDLTQQLQDVRKLTATAKGDRLQKAQAIEKEITGLLDQHRLDVLELGSPGRLLIAKEIEEVLPLDDPGILEQAKPVTSDGRVKLDPEKTRLRRDAQVKLALADGPFALIVLGGSHDLSDSVRRLGNGTCEYIRVTTRSYLEIAGEK